MADPSITYSVWPCAVCSRASKGVAFTFNNIETEPFCSISCMEAFVTAKKNKEPLDQREIEAIQAGGRAAGGFLDQIGKTSLDQLTQPEWDEFCTTLFCETCSELRRQARADVPF